MTARIIIKDHGARALVEKLRAKPRRLKVGVIGSPATETKLAEDGDAGDITVAQVATAHEFGIGVPRRSFIRDYVKLSERDIRRRLDNIAKQVIKTRGRTSIDQGLELLGVKIQGEIQERISSSIPPPNSPVTIAKKGSETTLIDTGQLRSSITWALDDKVSA